MSNRMLVLVVLFGMVVIGGIIGLAILPGLEEGHPSELKKFSSVDELRTYLKEHEQQYRDYYPYPPSVMEDSGVRQTGTAVKSVPLSTPLINQAVDYSTTNVQVEGVDEADFVKNDGKYIYILSSGTLVIVDAYPADKVKIVSTTPVDGQPAEMFIQGDRLVVFSTLQDEQFVYPRESAVPVPVWRPVTRAYIYSLGDRTSPVLVKNMSLSGNYYDSRLIGDQVYAITRESVQWIRDLPVVPQVAGGEGMVRTPDIYYFNIPEAYYQYHTISSFAMHGTGQVEAETFLLGQATTLYVSPDALYMAYRMSPPVYQAGEGPSPLVMTEQDMYTQERTLIHKFTIEGGRVQYAATGEVGGELLNQFSMDEYDSHLRVATTIEGWGQKGSYLYNNVYILDAGMKTVGTLEFIAPEERIYSTRFIGEKLYMVTFKRVDPFFVIDLSDPEHPGILGKLKIPGFSDYLHPYDSDHIIGIGKQTEENQWGGISTGGLKIALFDVTDVNNPLLIDQVEIGEAGTDSEALQDHKAFLFDKGKNLLVIPVREVEKIALAGGKYPSYTQKIWQGAYVFNVRPDSGFTLSGRVTHDSDDSAGYYWGSPSAVTRSLFMDDVLYTLSSQELIASNLNDLTKTIRIIPLPFSGAGYPYPLPMKGSSQ
jgi:inhibitor of cysteine peptidase